MLTRLLTRLLTGLLARLITGLTLLGGGRLGRRGSFCGRLHRSQAPGPLGHRESFLDLFAGERLGERLGRLRVALGLRRCGRLLGDGRSEFCRQSGGLPGGIRAGRQ